MWIKPGMQLLDSDLPWLESVVKFSIITLKNIFLSEVRGRLQWTNMTKGTAHTMRTFI